MSDLLEPPKQGSILPARRSTLQHVRDDHDCCWTSYGSFPTSTSLCLVVWTRDHLTIFFYEVHIAPLPSLTSPFLLTVAGGTARPLRGTHRGRLIPAVIYASTCAVHLGLLCSGRDARYTARLTFITFTVNYQKPSLSETAKDHLAGVSSPSNSLVHSFRRPLAVTTVGG